MKLKNPLLLYGIFILSFLIYFLSHGRWDDNLNYFILLADAFGKGQLGIIPTGIDHNLLNELVLVKGYYYVIYAPLPSVFLIPAVKIFGTDFYQPIISWFFGSFNNVLCFLVIQKAFSKKIAFWATLLYAFGTIEWFHTAVGSTWYLAQIVGQAFIWLMLLESLNKKRIIVLAAFVGLAYLSRYPMFLSLIFIPLFLGDQFLKLTRHHLPVFNWKNIFFLILGIGPFLFINSLYNLLRYGVIYDQGYSLLPIFDDYEYRFGLFSWKYLPEHLTWLFTTMPHFIPKFPFMIPSLNEMAIWIVIPTIFLAFFANYKDKLIFSSAISALVISLSGLLHGSVGESQFGYRFALDFLPFLIILIADGLNRKYNIFSKSLIVISVTINLWGIALIRWFNLWKF